MSDEIGFDDLKLDYVSIAEARRMSGLRLVLGAYTVPGPWRESCKGIFYVKGLDYTPVRTANEGASDLAIGMEGSQSELIAWTAQSSAPVAIWNDERPRSLWNDQLNLAERLAPEPRLIPADIEDRIRMFGLINELAGENGIAWSQRLLMAHGPLSTLPPDDESRPFWQALADKYGYTPAGAEAACRHIAGIFGTFDAQLASQKSRGHRYLMGPELTAVDIYFACFLGLFKPMPPERCPMATAYRPAYSNDDPAVEAAITPALLAHRDFVYERHLELPIVF